jgi:hypothetical protein
MWQDDEEIGRTVLTITTSARRAEYSAEQVTQMQERLRQLHLASGIESEFGPWPRSSSSQELSVDARHLALLVAIHLQDSSPEILDELRMRLDKSRPSFELVRQAFSPVETFLQEFIRAAPEQFRLQLRQRRIDPDYSAIADGRQFGYLRAIGVTTGASTLTFSSAMASRFGIEPLDPEIEQTIADHLLGYWDHILLTGAIHLLTADEGKDEGKGEVEEEAAEDAGGAEEE